MILKKIDWIIFYTALLGGLNWGMIGLTRINFITTIFPRATIYSRSVYVLIGLCCLYVAFVFPLKAKVKSETISK